MNEAMPCLNTSSTCSQAPLPTSLTQIIGEHSKRKRPVASRKELSAAPDDMGTLPRWDFAGAQQQQQPATARPQSPPLLGDERLILSGGNISSSSSNVSIAQLGGGSNQGSLGKVSGSAVSRTLAAAGGQPRQQSSSTAKVSPGGLAAMPLAAASPLRANRPLSSLPLGNSISSETATTGPGGTARSAWARSSGATTARPTGEQQLARAPVPPPGSGGAARSSVQHSSSSARQQDVMEEAQVLSRPISVGNDRLARLSIPASESARPVALFSCTKFKTLMRTPFCLHLTGTEPWDDQASSPKNHTALPTTVSHSSAPPPLPLSLRAVTTARRRRWAAGRH